MINKIAKIRKFTAETICGLIVLAGIVLHIFFGIGWLATLLMLLGGCGLVVTYGFNITRKYIKSKCSIGRKVRICYIVGFAVLATSVVLMITTNDFYLFSWSFLAYFALWITATYLKSIEQSEDFLLEEQERKRKFEEDDDLEMEANFEK